MADLDYGELRVYPGNYDEYMTAATQVRERLLADNAKKKSQIAELQTFVSRFSANASKARQATSRARQIEKIKLEDVKPSSRANPFLRFEQEKKLYRLALEVKRLGKGYDGGTLFQGLNLTVPVGERVAIIGPNGIGKTTLLRTLVGELTPDSGTVKWSEKCPRRLFRPGPRRRLCHRPVVVRLDEPMETAGRRRAGDPRHPRAVAVFTGRGCQTGSDCLRRRAGAHAVRQADVAAAKRAGHG